MIRRQLLRLTGALLLGLTIFGLSNHRGSANVDAEERKLEAFVEAAVAVEDVMAAWQPRIVRADDEDAEALRRQANLDIRQSIDRVDGISYDEYRDLRRTIAVDPAMRQRVTRLMQDLQHP